MGRPPLPRGVKDADDRFPLVFSAGQRDAVKAKADALGMSSAQVIRDAIDAYLAPDPGSPFAEIGLASVEPNPHLIDRTELLDSAKALYIHVTDWTLFTRLHGHLPKLQRRLMRTDTITEIVATAPYDPRTNKLVIPHQDALAFDAITYLMRNIKENAEETGAASLSLIDRERYQLPSYLIISEDKAIISLPYLSKRQDIALVWSSSEYASNIRTNLPKVNEGRLVTLFSPTTFV